MKQKMEIGERFSYVPLPYNKKTVKIFSTGNSGFMEPVATINKISLWELKVEVITRRMQLEAPR